MSGLRPSTSGVYLNPDYWEPHIPRGHTMNEHFRAHGYEVLGVGKIYHGGGGRLEDWDDYVFTQHTTVGINGWKEPYPMRAVRDSRYKLIRNLAPRNEHFISGIHGSAIYKSWRRDAANDPDPAFRARFDLLARRPAEELFDLSVDPYEMNNLATDPGHAAIKARLAEQLDAWMTQQGDEGNIRHPDPIGSFGRVALIRSWLRIRTSGGWGRC
jgi:uncharacterized sulfatase